MAEIQSMYAQMGIDSETWEYGEAILERLAERFRKIDEIAEYNQLKVIKAMQDCQVGEACLLGTTGYGYNDLGRDTLEAVYAKIFHTEDALVRPQITCGTHALALALMSNLRPGDELLSPVGKPYDTLEEVIGIRPSRGSLAEYGVSYRQVDLKEDGRFDYDSIVEAMNPRTRLVTIQRSKGYQTRPTFSVKQIGELIAFVKKIKPDVICMVDNCYGEFVEPQEPSGHGGGLPDQEPGRRTGPHRRLHRREKAMRGERRVPAHLPWAWQGGGSVPGHPEGLLPGPVPGPHSDGLRPEIRSLRRQSVRKPGLRRGAERQREQA